jgi:hypothetical protein
MTLRSPSEPAPARANWVGVRPDGQIAGLNADRRVSLVLRDEQVIGFVCFVIHHPLRELLDLLESRVFGFPSYQYCESQNKSAVRRSE